MWRTLGWNLRRQPASHRFVRSVCLKGRGCLWVSHLVVVVLFEHVIRVRWVRWPVNEHSVRRAVSGVDIQQIILLLEVLGPPVYLSRITLLFVYVAISLSGTKQIFLSILDIFNKKKLQKKTQWATVSLGTRQSLGCLEGDSCSDPKIKHLHHHSAHGSSHQKKFLNFSTFVTLWKK